MEESTKKSVKKPDLMNLLIFILDYLAIVVSYFVALASLFDFDIKYAILEYDLAIYQVTPFYAMGVCILFFFFKLYNNGDGTKRMKETVRLLLANFISVVVYITIMMILKTDYPYAFYLIGGLLQFFFTAGIRFIFRFFKHLD